MIYVILYVESIDQTLILAEHRGRIYACHWAGRQTQAQVQKIARAGGIMCHPYDTSSGAYVAGRPRQFMTIAKQIHG